MKTTYTNEQLQEAIDVAFHGSSGSHLTTMKYSEEGNWNGESRARLDIARAFLNNLPEQTEQEVLSLSQLRPLSEAGEVPEGCVRVTAFYVDKEWIVDSKGVHPGDTHFADIRLPVPAEKADPYAELKKAHAEGKVVQFKPHGCPWEDSEKPDFTAPIACYRIKPEPETFEAHGKTWTRHTPGDPMPCDGERMVYVLTPKTGESEEPCKASMYAWTCIFREGDWWGETIGWRYADEPLVTSPEWTPQAGDVVRLKSGGPLMTVGCPIEHTIPSVSCAWFDGTTLCSTPIPTACLEPSTKEDAQ